MLNQSDYLHYLQIRKVSKTLCWTVTVVIWTIFLVSWMKMKTTKQLLCGFILAIMKGKFFSVQFLLFFHIDIKFLFEKISKTMVCSLSLKINTSFLNTLYSLPCMKSGSQALNIYVGSSRGAFNISVNKWRWVGGLANVYSYTYAEHFFLFTKLVH